ncbi:(R)-mandelonitrile lyase [Carnimonas nigrificans]|uniref:(R)-mandelonitrile lyase n=1 Tax=Carnimonas nigrificans TaxID=64323 RepID=UPI000471B594|nr:cupin domain-containing protein [Carnimonas nigrificans]
MKIKRVGSIASVPGPKEWFTGTVRIDAHFAPPEPSRVSTAAVTFEPSARTAWHTHPVGQTLIVTAGHGWAQKEGEAIQDIYPGDIIYFEPEEKHWHGAAPDTAMTHVTIQEEQNGSPVTWMEQVSDEQYRK